MLDEIRMRHVAKLKDMEIKSPVKIVAEKSFNNFLDIPGMESNRSFAIDSNESTQKSKEPVAK